MTPEVRGFQVGDIVKSRRIVSTTGEVFVGIVQQAFVPEAGARYAIVVDANGKSGMLFFHELEFATSGELKPRTLHVAKALA